MQHFSNNVEKLCKAEQVCSCSLIKLHYILTTQPCFNTLVARWCFRYEGGGASSWQKQFLKWICSFMDVPLYVGPGIGVRCGRCEGEGSHEDLAACAAPPIQHLRQDQSCAALYLQHWRYIILPQTCLPSFSVH